MLYGLCSLFVCGCLLCVFAFLLKCVCVIFNAVVCVIAIHCVMLYGLRFVFIARVCDCVCFVCECSCERCPLFGNALCILFVYCCVRLYGLFLCCLFLCV